LNENVREEDMKELLETLAKALVEKPDEVSVNVIESEKSTLLELRVAKEDMGRVIGKQGRIANAIRVIMKAQAIKLEKKVIIEIVE
jgi:uncharacterized protein